MSKDKTVQRSYQNKILTIPNVLSFFRLCLIPVIIWMYCSKRDYVRTAVILLLSGATDILDGFIARRFNMVSDLGKVLDPVADKLTQGCAALPFDPVSDDACSDYSFADEGNLSGNYKCNVR